MNSPDGQKILLHNGKLHVPDHPIIPFIIGDGTGPDIWCATVRVLEAAIAKAYRTRRRIVWKEILAGEKAFNNTGEWLPQATLDAIREHHVAIKGPLTTPVGGGIRSLNVTLRQTLDLYACVRPVRHFPGVPSPVREPEKLNVVIFRENTEDVYAGIEWAEGSDEARKVIQLLKQQLGVSVREDSGIGVKPISRFATQRLVRRAIQYAIAHRRRSVTLVHKGNIMKFTEGAFRQWAYELARKEFPNETITQDDLANQPGEPKAPPDKILVKDVLADNMFQQILLRPSDFDVIAAPNLNGDYLSDACAAQVGGLGMAPGANIGDEHAVFEATHGTAPKYAFQDKVNPSSLLLSGVMMLEHLGWQEAADMVLRAMERTFAQKTVTYDLERQMDGATLVSCSQFATNIINTMD